MKVHHFTDGDFGYYADWWDTDDIWWDGKGGNEPTEEDIKEAHFHWSLDGHDEALKAAHEDALDALYEEADNRLNRMKEDE